MAESKGFARRLREVVEYGYGGSQALLADHAHVSASLVSRVLSGRQNAPFELLASIAEKTDVNLRWLISGIGDIHESATTEFLLPRSKTLLPGLPTDGFELCDGVLPVLKTLYRPTRYFFVVTQPQAVGNLELKKDDKLLIEADVTENLPIRKNQLLVEFDPDDGLPILTAAQSSQEPLKTRRHRNIKLRGKSGKPSSSRREVPQSRLLGVCLAFARNWD